MRLFHAIGESDEGIGWAKLLKLSRMKVEDFEALMYRLRDEERITISLDMDSPVGRKPVIVRLKRQG